MCKKKKKIDFKMHFLPITKGITFVSQSLVMSESLKCGAALKLHKTKQRFKGSKQRGNVNVFQH